MTDIVDLDLMTPGSTWHRNDGRASRLLMLTNTHLPEKLREQFPVMVIYADEKDNILSVGVDEFLAKRKFYNIDPLLESRLNNLLALSPSAGGEDFSFDDGDDLLVTDEGDQETDQEGTDDPVGSVFDLTPDGTDSDADLVSGEVNSRNHTVSFVVENAELAQVIDAQLLATKVDSYQQTPNVTDGTVTHTLFIRAEDGINSRSLYQAFSGVEGHAVLTTQIDVEGSVLSISPDAFIGVYPAMFYGVTVLQLVFATNAVQPEEFEPVESLEAAAADVAATLVAEAVAAAEAQPETLVVQPQAVPIAVQTVAVKPVAVNTGTAAA